MGATKNGKKTMKDYALMVSAMQSDTPTTNNATDFSKRAVATDLPIGVKFVIVKGFNRVIANGGNESIIPFFACVATDDSEMTFQLSASAISRSARNTSGEMITPKSVLKSLGRDEMLASTKVMGVQFANLADALHKQYGELAEYEIIGTQSVTCKRREDDPLYATEPTYQRTVYAIVVYPDKTTKAATE